MSESRRLAVFDFDYTIVNDNSDIYVRDLLRKDLIPTATRKLYKSDGWTAYMQGVFKLLYAHGFDESRILARLCEIQPTTGIFELLQYLKDSANNTDIIVISDSNDYFINAWLKHNNMTDYVNRVFSNPASFINGRLTIEMYHLQTNCKLSTKNLCKGQIMDDFIATRAKDANIIYDRILYVGDGANDLCPMLRLRRGDVAYVRKGYKCEALVKCSLEGRPIHLTGEIHEMKANVVMWDTGLDILHSLNNSSN